MALAFTVHLVRVSSLTSIGRDLTRLSACMCRTSVSNHIKPRASSMPRYLAKSMWPSKLSTVAARSPS